MRRARNTARLLSHTKCSNLIQRQRGLGAKMMERAEEQARAGGYAVMALHTRTDNPARRLYERFGFEEAGEATDPEFERLTGVRGNVLYVKQLD